MSKFTSDNVAIAASALIGSSERLLRYVDTLDHAPEGTVNAMNDVIVNVKELRKMLARYNAAQRLVNA